MKDNCIVSFEKGKNGVKVKSSKRRISVPGRIEREEMLRADMIELAADLRVRLDKNSWYNAKVL